MTKEFVISLHKPFWGRAEEKAGARKDRKAKIKQQE